MISYDFSNKIVLVTASSKGIGFAIAKGFYRAGAKVAICSRTEENINKAVNNIKNDSAGEIVGFKCDLSDTKQCAILVDKVEKHYSLPINILINNSGGPPAKKISDTDSTDWMDAINTNLLSSIMLSKKVVRSMAENKWGRIIYLTSSLSKEPADGMVLSNVTRAGVAAFSKTLSREVASNGITVNTVLTGGCKTDRFYSLVEKQILNTDESIEDAVERISKTIPVGYISTPDEFSKTILFLASPEASYINGVTLPLDGGALRSIF